MDTNAYTMIFNYIKNNLNVNAPKYNIIDFESGLYKSLREVFHEAKLYGCLFHFGQIVWRKLNSFGFSAKYNQENTFSWHVRLILSLAFVPVQDLILFVDV
jgi:hypothetical protein